MQAAPGWYADPRGGDGYRYWTGDGWAPDPGPSFPPKPTTPPPAAAPAARTGWERPDPRAPQRAGPDAVRYEQVGGFESPPGPADVPPWRRVATWIALAIGLALGFGAGFVIADRRADDGSPGAFGNLPLGTSTPTPAPTDEFGDTDTDPDEQQPRPSPSDGRSTDPDASLLNRLGLRPTDVAPDVRIQLIPGGGEVVGQTTLDLCDAQYASEFRRTARRQLIAVDKEDAVVLSTEAVLYRTADDTAKAFEELRANSTKCDAQTGVDAKWPTVEGVERLVFQVYSNGAGGRTLESTIVYMRRDRTLLALYFRHPGVGKTPVAGHQTIDGVVGVYSKRLAAMPAAAGTPT